MNKFIIWLFLLSGLSAINPGMAQEPMRTKSIRDIAYVENGHERQKLDLYLPEMNDAPSVPIVVWVHGGGWSGGSKSATPARPLIELGFAVASINYRLSQHATFPAQIHDCKAAVRWLRAHAKEFRINPERIGVWGSSAGGQLVALMGVSNNLPDLEGSEGALGFSSDVQAVVDWFGPTDFLTVGSKDTRTKMLGGDPQILQDVAKRASPFHHVNSSAKSTKGFPPFLIMHGTQDKTVPISQSEVFAEALQKAGAVVHFEKVENAGHGGPQFQDTSTIQRVAQFFTKHLRGDHE